MREIIIGFSTPKKFHLSSHLIKCFERSEYSHIYIKMKARQGSPLAFDKVFQASRGDVNAMTFDNFSTYNKIIHEYRLTIQDETYYKVATFLWSQLGKPYGFMQLLNIAVNREIFKNSSKAYICSELAGIVLEEFLGFNLSESQDMLGLNDIRDLLKEHQNAIS